MGFRFLVFFQNHAGVCKIDVQRRVSLGKLQGLAVMERRVFKISQLFMGKAQILQGGGKFSLIPNGLFKRLQGLGVLFARAVGIAEIKPGIGEIGPDGNCFL